MARLHVHMRPGWFPAALLLAALLLPAGGWLPAPGGGWASAAAPSAAAEAAPAARALRVESIAFRGQWKTREALLARTLALAPGDAVDAAALAAARARLVETGWFDAVDVSAEPGSERGLLRVLVSLRERQRPYLDTGFGFRDPEGWYLTLVGLRVENPVGLGGRATAGLQLGFRTAGAEAEWLQPLTAGGALAARLRLRIQNEKLLWYENEPGWIGLYDEHRLDLERAEAALSLIARPRRPLALELGLSAASVEPEAEGENRDTDAEIPPYRLPPAFQAETGRRQLTGALVGLTLGEGGLNGAPGASLSLRGRIASEVLGAEADYARWTFAARGTVALPPGHRLALGLRGGWVGERAPYYERFRLGGSYSLRGFRDHSLSPPEGHDGFFSGALEYRVPLLAARRGLGDEERGDGRGASRGRNGERLSALAFADAGRGWLERAGALAEPDVDYEEWQLGAGYGLRLTLPWLGTLGLDVGFPVTAGITGEPVWVYLTLGHSF